MVGGASDGQHSIQSCSQATLNPSPLFSSPRKNHPDQGADWRQRPSAQKPALCHSGCHRSRRPVAQSHDSPVRGHDWLPVSAAAPAHRLLFSHPGGYQALGECSRQRLGQIYSFMVLFLTRRSTLRQDLLVHVRDISHPETINQKVNVLNVLRNLQMPDKLMNSMIEVHNKIDLIDK